MGTALISPNLVLGAIRAAGASGSVASGYQQGIFASVVDTGTGDHLWTLSEGINAEEVEVIIGHCGAGARMMSYVFASATTLQVLFYNDAGAAADAVTSYTVTIRKLSIG